CTDHAISDDDGGSDAHAQDGSCCAAVPSSTVLSRATLTVQPAGADALSQPIDVSGYDSLSLQWFETGGSCENDIEVIIEQQLVADAPFARVSYAGSSPSVVPVPILGPTTMIRLHEYNTLPQACTIEYILVGVKNDLTPAI